MGRRLSTLCGLVILAFVIDICALFNLQIINVEKYKVLSEKNRVKVRVLIPKRGNILDRNDLKIAYNIPVYKVSIINDDVKNIAQRMENLKTYLSSFDLNETQTLSLSQKLPPHAYITIKNNLTWNEYTVLTVNNLGQKGVLLEQDYVRKYNNRSYSHLIGYIGQTESNSILKNGKQGLEKSYNDYLQGIFGNQKIEVNSSMRLVRTLETISAIDGNNLKLTIDDKLQNFIYKTLINSEAASCVVLDINTGEILACVSVPTFEQNDLANGISSDRWKELINNKFHPLNDRALKSAYPPGSVFKIFLAYAALKSKIISAKERIFCPGHIKLGSDMFHCWNRAGHGSLSLKEAIASSCDVYFFEIAKRLGIDKLSSYANLFGFGNKVCVDIPFEGKGLMPDRAWKASKYNKKWYTYETLLTGIGQGNVLATTVQLAVATARLWKGNFDLKARIIFSDEISDYETNNDPIVQIIRDSMFAVCNEYYGTAISSCSTAYGIAGKTGSSQVRRLKIGEHGISQNTLKWKDRDHGLFVGVAPYKNPKYVISVILEHGGGGGKAAVVARKILDKIISEGKTLK